MSTQQQPLFAAPATDSDEAWLAQVREDAGRWWASTDREHVAHTCPLLVYPQAGVKVDRYYVWHRASSEDVGGGWPERRAAQLWLWLALRICQWQTLPDVATARGTYGEELDAAEARLRRALGGAA